MAPGRPLLQRRATWSTGSRPKPAPASSPTSCQTSLHPWRRARPGSSPKLGGQLLDHLVSRLYEPPRANDLRRMADFRGDAQDDHRTPRSCDAPLRDHRDRKRLLAVQESVLKATDPPAARPPRWAHRNLPHAVRRQPRGGRVGPSAGPSYGLPVRRLAVHPQRGQHCTPIGGNVQRRLTPTGTGGGVVVGSAAV